MKTIFSLGSAICLTLPILLGSCTKEQATAEAVPTKVRVVAGFDEYTRTTLSGRDVVWQEGE